MADFARAQYTLAGHGDPFLRFILPEATMFTGEDQYGMTVSVMCITGEDIASYVSFAGDPWASMERNIPRGWYLIRQNSDGIVWGFFYGDDHKGCIDDYTEFEEEYLRWSAGCPHEDCGHGECSWLQGGLNGACDVHGNNKGRCQRVTLQFPGFPPIQGVGPVITEKKD